MKRSFTPSWRALSWRGKRRSLSTGLALASVAAGTMLVASGAVAGGGSVTGYPTHIAKLDLAGYQLQTFYPLGANTGNTFDQLYRGDGTVAAVGVKGPGTGVKFASKYVAMPVGHAQLMVTWYKRNGTITDVFVMNFRTGIVSDVAPGANPPSLGTVKILKRGTRAIP